MTDTPVACWREICPGQTSREEVARILEDLPEVSWVRTVEPTDVASVPRTSWSFSTDAGVGGRTGACYYRHDDDRVAYCTVDLYGLRLEHVIDKYGTPDGLEFVVLQADSRTLTILMLYRDRGVAAVHSDLNWRSEKTVVLSPAMRVGCVYIYDPELYDGLKRDPYFMLNYLGVHHPQLLWHGYGEYEMPEN